MTYFTSDLHFGHYNIIRYCQRPFENTDEMDEAIIAAWNNKVKEDDEVYILGDIALKSAKVALANRLNGKKHLIIGNHDYHNLESIAEIPFESVSFMKVIKEQGKTLTLCHFPTYSFIGDYLLYGHVHNNESDASWIAVRKNENALNVCMDVNGLVPVTLDELIENNRVYLDKAE